jgi:hypothetical protein
MQPTINTAMSEMLNALGFEAMAREVLAEDDVDRLRKYARVIIKNSPEPIARKAANLFRMHRPTLY